jgi:hypothetical protein
MKKLILLVLVVTLFSCSIYQQELQGVFQIYEKDQFGGVRSEFMDFVGAGVTHTWDNSYWDGSSWDFSSGSLFYWFEADGQYLTLTFFDGSKERLLYRLNGNILELEILEGAGFFEVWEK